MQASVTGNPDKETTIQEVETAGSMSKAVGFASSSMVLKSNLQTSLPPALHL